MANNWSHEFYANKRNTPHLRERQLFLGCVLFFIGLDHLLFGYGPWGEAYRSVQGNWAGIMTAVFWFFIPLMVAPQPRKSDMEYGSLAFWGVIHFGACLFGAFIISPVWIMIWIEETILTVLMIITQKKYNYRVLTPRTAGKKK